MNKSKAALMTFTATIALSLLGGCQNPGIIQLSEDTFLLSRSDAGGAFANTAALKAEVIQEANAFAASKGKTAIPISTNEQRPTHGFPSFEYQFRLVEKGSPDARGASLSPAPNFIIEKRENTTADIKTKDLTEKAPDMYTELLKLDELRKKGLITDAEFESQKVKLLNRAK